jgi:hypothetical protein
MSSRFSSPSFFPRRRFLPPLPVRIPNHRRFVWESGEFLQVLGTRAVSALVFFCCSCGWRGRRRKGDLACTTRVYAFGADYPAAVRPDPPHALLVRQWRALRSRRRLERHPLPVLFSHAPSTHTPPPQPGQRQLSGIFFRFQVSTHHVGWSWVHVEEGGERGSRGTSAERAGSTRRGEGGQGSERGRRVPWGRTLVLRHGGRRSFLLRPRLFKSLLLQKVLAHPRVFVA